MAYQPDSLYGICAPFLIHFISNGTVTSDSYVIIAVRLTVQS